MGTDERLIDNILAAMDSHAARNLELARATLEAAAAQAAILDEQKLQTQLLHQKEALERGQFLKISEIALTVASHQELLASINQRLRFIEDTQRLALDFIRAVVEAQPRLSEKPRKRLEIKLLKREPDSIRRELQIHYQSLAAAKEKAARYGINIPLEITNEIEFLTDEIEQLEGELDVVMNEAGS